MGFHIKSRLGEGFWIKTPESDVRVILKYITPDDSCGIEIHGSQFIPDSTVGNLSKNSSVILAQNIELKLEDIGRVSERVKFYIEKPRDYRIYRI